MWEDTSERGHVRLREVCHEAGILQGLVELGNKRTQRRLRGVATTCPYRRESSKSQMEGVQDGYTTTQYPLAQSRHDTKAAELTRSRVCLDAHVP